MNFTQMNIILKLIRKYGKRIVKVSDVPLWGNPCDPDKVAVTYTMGQDDKATTKTRTFTLDEQGELKEVEVG